LNRGQSGKSSLSLRNSSGIFLKHFRVTAGDPDLDMLRCVVKNFADIPYENITKIISKFECFSEGEMIRGPDQVIGGYLREHTGGTCFSLTFYLGSILSDCGFRCYPVMADMKKPNIHCALVVHIGGKRYLADPGYLIGEPVELTGERVDVSTSFGRVELRPADNDSYNLYTFTGDRRKWRYTVKTKPVPIPLFMRYWRQSFSLPMMNSIQLTRISERGHLYIRNHHLRLSKGNRKLNENIRKQMESRIMGEFGIPESLTSRARELLAKDRAGKTGSDR
jgi:arylamine N-acetyltransferase